MKVGCGEKESAMEIYDGGVQRIGGGVRRIGLQSIGDGGERRWRYGESAAARGSTDSGSDDGRMWTIGLRPRPAEESYTAGTKAAFGESAAAVAAAAACCGRNQQRQDDGVMRSFGKDDGVMRSFGKGDGEAKETK